MERIDIEAMRDQIIDIICPEDDRHLQDGELLEIVKMLYNIMTWLIETSEKVEE